ncbi:MAG: hypothetical protein AB7S77_04480 [Desulfatirhabdiaceae bacterium]
MHIGICAGGCNAADGAKDKQDVDLFVSDSLAHVDAKVVFNFDTICSFFAVAQQDFFPNPMSHITRMGIVDPLDQSFFLTILYGVVN